jgi:hypothetical protein
MTTPLLSEYLSEHETAAQLDICVRTLRRWRDLKTGPAFVKIGRRTMYRRSTVAGWLAKQERAGSAV